MKKLLGILVLGLLLSGNAYADKEDLRRGASKLGSVSDAYWEQNTLVIHLLEPKTNFRSLGSSICRGGAQYYQVEKNYKIRFINHYNNSEVLSLFRCTPDV
jgi:hypothetical protein